MMQRTQIYLPEEIKMKAQKLANRRGVPLAAVVRQALEKEIKETAVPKENPLIHLAKLKIKGGPKDLSSKFDEYLYGDK